MLAVTPFSVKREATKPNNNNTIEAVREEKKEPEPSPGETEEQHSDDQKHKEKCNICQSKVGLSPNPSVRHSHWSSFNEACSSLVLYGIRGFHARKVPIDDSLRH